jgi:hypothetical protein
MNELFNIIKNSLKSSSFYIPSQDAFVKGGSMTIKQYNDILELDATLDYGFEQAVKLSTVTDIIIRENLESVENILYFDKPFILAQIKLAQEKNFLGYSLEEYQQVLKEKMSSISLSSYETTFSFNDIEIQLGLNSFQIVEQVTKDYQNSLENKYNATGDIIILELFKHLKNIKYHNQSVSTNKGVSEIKPLLQEMPSSLVNTFNTIFQKINSDTTVLNTHIIKRDKFIFNPTIEFMLS